MCVPWAILRPQSISSASRFISQGNFTWVTGTFTVPTPLGSPGDSAAAWVGIDGDTCQSAIFQTGVDFTVSSNGLPEYNGKETLATHSSLVSLFLTRTAWYEWYSDVAYYFSGITISAGDVISLAVIASSATSGEAIIDNLTNGDTVKQFLTSNTPLCGQNTEWIVEDYEVNGDFVPFANFGTVTFTDAVAESSGNFYYPSQGSLNDIEQNNQVLTSSSASGSSVTIMYL
jgi:hypothetical protein